MESDVDNFLAHYGIKGMKWGVIRDRDDSSGGGSGSKPASSTKSATSTKTAAKKTASPPNPTSKSSTSQQPEGLTKRKVATELTFGSIGPAALLAGLGPPLTAALSLTVMVLRTPPVSTAIARTSKASADLMKEVGQTKLKVMREARESKKKLKDAVEDLDESRLVLGKL